MGIAPAYEETTPCVILDDKGRIDVDAMAIQSLYDSPTAKTIPESFILGYRAGFEAYRKLAIEIVTILDKEQA